MTKKQGFTLIELLAVIGILIILMGFVIPTVGKAMQKSNLAVSKSMIEKLEMAVRNYYSAFDQYPENLSRYYLGQKHFSESFGALMPVLQFEEKWILNKSQSQEDWIYKDPWGEPYYFFWDLNNPTVDYDALKLYMTNDGRLDELGMDKSTGGPFVLNHGFLLWSQGPDMITGSADDIGNWGKTRSKMM